MFYFAKSGWLLSHVSVVIPNMPVFHLFEEEMFSFPAEEWLWIKICESKRVYEISFQFHRFCCDISNWIASIFSPKNGCHTKGLTLHSLQSYLLSRHSNAMSCSFWHKNRTVCYHIPCINSDYITPALFW